MQNMIRYSFLQGKAVNERKEGKDGQTDHSDDKCQLGFDYSSLVRLDVSTML